ncbi:hypothetical protein BD779DRAFT_1487580 [Infundibulicybe gibba]|nr:hypothetical protein BD779DRAFT_1487580 [Infundibulicybe gibba]
MSNSHGTPRPSHLSPTTATLSPTWGPPKAPLPPHRLAKLANALAVHSPNTFVSSSYQGSTGSMDQFRRSPTPSMASNTMNSYVPTTSKYLLHVIPPLDLPHDSDSFDNSELTPPPPSASGYHTQFRRGTLVPVHSTLQSQLGAIAKEYALPNTTGMILYLVSSTPNMGTQLDGLEEPGPRISDDIWKHVWGRVMKAEQHDDPILLPSRSPTPHMFGALGTGGRSTPYLPQESGNHPLRPLISAVGSEAGQHPAISYPFTPSPSTPSTSSDLHSNTKSAPPSSSSISLSEPETPDTSYTSPSFVKDSAARAQSFDLPGLNSPSIIPVLAKVEFDIDQRKATWYEPWIRSRRMNHAKRAESRTGRKMSISESADGEDGPEVRNPPIHLITGRQQTASPISLLSSPLVNGSIEKINDAESEKTGYMPLTDTESLNEEDDEEDFAEDATTRVASIPPSVDPLGEVFGSDADTWADLQASNPRRSRSSMDPNITDLSLAASDLSSSQISELDEGPFGEKEEDEVHKLLEQMSRPHLSLSIPSSPPNAVKKRSSSPTSKKHIPPPLVLAPVPSSDVPAPPTSNAAVKSVELVVPAEASPMPSSAGSVSSKTESSNEDDEKVYNRVRSPEESEKRGGAVFDDIDLGLDPTEEFDDDDPHDRRRSQYLMKAQLDEIERTMAQLSPRMLKADLEEDPNSSFSSATLSPHSPAGLSLSSNGMLNADFYPPSPRLPQHIEFDDRNSHRDQSAAWPAVPFASLHGDDTASGPPATRPVNAPPSPPRLAVNGVTTSAPKSYSVSRSPADISTETESRRRELEEEQAAYPGLNPNFGKSSPSSEAPIIPFLLIQASGSSRQSTYWEHDVNGHSPAVSLDIMTQSMQQSTYNRARSSATTSRFSADSITGEEPVTKPSNRTTLMAVKSISKLWRKTNKNSISGPPPPHPLPHLDELDLPPVNHIPTTPTFGKFPPQPPPSRQSQEHLANPNPLTPSVSGRTTPTSHPPIVAAQMLHKRGDPSLDRLHFDQESPYPTRRPSGRTRPPSPQHLPPVPEKEKMSVRKSILKSWKSASGGSQQNAAPEQRPSLERPGSATGRPRRPSVLNFGSSRGSVTPQIPEQFINPRNTITPDQPLVSRSAFSPTDSSSPPAPSTRSISPRRSMASSRDSEETRPSFDVSQFEIVSPKLGSALSYPYHGLDHD